MSSTSSAEPHEGGSECESDEVSLAGAIAIGIGGMVGGGIFAVLGVAAERAGGATPVAFTIAGVVAALTAYSYSKLSVRYPSEGGTVKFVDEVFGVDAITGSINILLWAGYIATTALYAAAFGHYGATLLPGDLEASTVAFKSLALVGVLIPWIINLAKARLIARAEGIVVAIKLVILLLVVGAGVPSAQPARLSRDTWTSPMSIIAAGMLVFVAYEGFELIANSSADVVRPRRNLPLAFGLSVGIVIVLYVAISAVVVGSLTADEISAAADFALAEAAASSLGRAGFFLVGISAVLATFSAINATLYGAARLSFTIATEGELPATFRNRYWEQPVGLHLTAVAGAAIAVGLPLASISSLSSSIFLVVFAFVNLTAAKAGRDIGARRVVCVAGAVLAVASFVVLTIQNIGEDPLSLVVLAALAGGALLLERRLLQPGRSPFALAHGRVFDGDS